MRKVYLLNSWISRLESNDLDGIVIFQLQRFMFYLSFSPDGDEEKMTRSSKIGDHNPFKNNLLGRRIVSCYFLKLQCFLIWPLIKLEILIMVSTQYFS